MHVELIARGEKYQREMKRAQDRANGLSSDLVSLGGVVRRIAGVFGAFKLVDFAKDATLAAARYETLGVVTEVVGRNAGYSASQMAEFEQGLRSTGIAAVESRETLARMVQAQVDLSHSTDLARVAQNAAVIANTNSSDAFNRLVYGIQSAQVETLRTMGLNVNFETSYARLAKQLGKNAQDLTELEKTQARVNVVLQAGEQIQGTYEASMETAGKQLGSMKRLVDDLMVSLGNAVLPEFTKAIFEASDGLKDIQANIEPVVQTLRIFSSMMVATFRTVANSIQLAFGALTATILDVLSFAARGVEGFTNMMNLIPGVNLKAIVSSQELAATAGLVRESMSRDLGQIGDAWNNVLLAVNSAVSTAAPKVDTLAVSTANVATAVQIANVPFREMSVTLPTVTAGVQGLATAQHALAIGTNAAADAQDRLNDAMGRAQGFLGALGALGGAFKFAIPGLGQASGLLSAFQGFKGLFADGGHIPSGGWGIVGERGPEIVQGPADVTPMSQVGGVTEIVLPSPRNMTDRIAIDWLAESLKQLEHSGFRVRLAG